MLKVENQKGKGLGPNFGVSLVILVDFTGSGLLWVRESELFIRGL